MGFPLRVSQLIYAKFSAKFNSLANSSHYLAVHLSHPGLAPCVYYEIRLPAVLQELLKVCIDSEGISEENLQELPSNLVVYLQLSDAKGSAVSSTVPISHLMRI